MQAVSWSSKVYPDSGTAVFGLDSEWEEDEDEDVDEELMYLMQASTDSLLWESQDGVDFTKEEIFGEGFFLSDSDTIQRAVTAVSLRFLRNLSGEVPSLLVLGTRKQQFPGPHLFLGAAFLIPDFLL